MIVFKGIVKAMVSVQCQGGLGERRGEEREKERAQEKRGVKVVYKRGLEGAPCFRQERFPSPAPRPRRQGVSGPTVLAPGCVAFTPSSS